ncbi:Uncharacterized protein Fot_37694 [Forsythia ovata]|uniref:Uncharacterized protein n=1 Tax=Forsythia ovata TaxID=205694 RepID=A0ABD1RZT7_9LAMI
MGSQIDTTSSFWKCYFSIEEDARKIDIFDLINASITVASFKKPNDEFRSRRLQIIESLFATDSQAVAKPKKESLLIAEALSKNEIEKSKKKVQILDVKDIVPPPPKLGRSGKPKRGFGSRMKKI